MQKGKEAEWDRWVGERQRVSQRERVKAALSCWFQTRVWVCWMQRAPGWYGGAIHFRKKWFSVFYCLFWLQLLTGPVFWGLSELLTLNAIWTQLHIFFFTLKPQLKFSFWQRWITKQRNSLQVAFRFVTFHRAAICRRSLVIRLAPASRECSGQRGEQYGAGAQISQPAGSAL